MAHRRKYSRFADRINIDAFESAIGFDPLTSTEVEDTGYCFDFFNLHAHGDTTGKLSINRDKKVYNCWVCGGGSLLDLVMALKGLDSEDATDWLYQFVDSEESEGESADRLKAKLFKEAEPKAPPLPFFNPRALERFESYHPWFAERGIDEQTAVTYRLKYAPQQMKRPPKGKHQDDEPYLGPAIVLPHFWKGKLVGWQNRWLDDDRPIWVKKYTNTADFPKEETLFNYDNVITASDPIVVCESVPTVLFLESAGIPAVATFGSSFSEQQIKYLRALRQGVYIAPDNDKAGRKFRDELTYVLKRFIDVWHVPMVGSSESKDDLGDLAPDCEAVYSHLVDAEQAGLCLTK